MDGFGRTTIVGILVLADRKLAAAELIRLAAPLGLSATNVKSHLTRMVAEGVLQREGPPRLALYGPSVDQLFVIDGIQARLAATPDEPWDQNWMMLAVRLPSHRGQRERLRAALWFDGWRPVSPGVFLRPAWPREWAESSALQYSTLTLGCCVRGVCVAAPEEFVSLYELDQLDSEACRLAAWIRRRSTSAMSPRKAFVERMRVGGRVAKLIGHDPRLPAEVWGKRHGLREVVDAFRRFEECVAPQSQVFLDNIQGRPALPIDRRRNA